MINLSTIKNLCSVETNDKFKILFFSGIMTQFNKIILDTMFQYLTSMDPILIVYPRTIIKPLIA